MLIDRERELDELNALLEVPTARREAATHDALLIDLATLDENQGFVGTLPLFASS